MILSESVDSYLAGLRPAPDPVLAEMEAHAARDRVPIVVPVKGPDGRERHVEVAALPLEDVADRGLFALRLRSWESQRHLTDFIRSLYWLIGREDMDGAVNVAAPNPLPNKEFMRILRNAAGVRIGLPATRLMLDAGAFFMRSEEVPSGRFNAGEKAWFWIGVVGLSVIVTWSDPISALSWSIEVAPMMVEVTNGREFTKASAIWAGSRPNSWASATYF